MITRKRRSFADMAAELHAIADRPKNQDIKWDWVKIGAALEVNARTAQQLVQWMRREYAELYWTVGTINSDYKTMATNSFRDALDGILDQQGHLITRLKTMQRSAATLATLDPDEKWRKLAARTAKHYDRRVGDEEELREVLLGYR